jgi:phage-related protein
VKPLFWVGHSKEALLAFPREVQRAMGRALMVAQQGGKDLHA